MLGGDVSLASCELEILGAFAGEEKPRSLASKKSDPVIDGPCTAPALKAKRYLESHRVVDFFQTAVSTVLSQRPEDPHATLAALFMCGYSSAAEAKQQEEEAAYPEDESPAESRPRSTIDVRVVSYDSALEGMVLSMRSGKVRRQVPAIKTGQVFRFPATSKQVRFKVEVLEGIAWHNILLHPGDETYEVELPVVGPGICCPRAGPAKFSLHLKRAASSGDSPTVLGSTSPTCSSSAEKSAFSVGGEVDSDVARSSVVSGKCYLEKHRILEVWQAAMEDVVQKQPDDPYAVVAAFFQVASMPLPASVLARVADVAAGTPWQPPHDVDVSNLVVLGKNGTICGGVEAAGPSSKIGAKKKRISFEDVEPLEPEAPPSQREKLVAQTLLQLCYDRFSRQPSRRGLEGSPTASAAAATAERQGQATEPSCSAVPSTDAAPKAGVQQSAFEIKAAESVASLVESEDEPEPQITSPPGEEKPAAVSGGDGYPAAAVSGTAEAASPAPPDTIVATVKDGALEGETSFEQQVSHESASSHGVFGSFSSVFGRRHGQQKKAPEARAASLEAPSLQKAARCPSPPPRRAASETPDAQPQDTQSLSFWRRSSKEAPAKDKTVPSVKISQAHSKQTAETQDADVEARSSGSKASATKPSGANGSKFLSAASSSGNGEQEDCQRADSKGSFAKSPRKFFGGLSGRWGGNSSKKATEPTGKMAHEDISSKGG
eukprot:TRINITY_DN30186_c0_g2_i3.p1 TRINITY_DN30186_c0_g2~~TRINITY_DN30186_c0_g2_i3.p1  ORF type:complete len:718 (+),score=194.17 TRINITY_DN30186_c0_g2_i3:112-2265(+)